GSKRPSFMPALAAIQLMLSVVLSALAALHIYLTVLHSRQVSRFMKCQNNQQAFQGLINESIAYATRTNRALIPALAEAGLKIVPSTNAPERATASGAPQNGVQPTVRAD
ncbi:MAG: hypothetical protein KIT22_18500, partial [Verrucomicrobiae bacterium]|nr:hypothetical protein [Verrucomicrobiae bacterium]